MSDMLDPVRCNYCGKVYDLANVKVIARYSDATVFKTPCCNRQADDRPWVSLPSFEKVKNEPWTCQNGRVYNWSPR